MSDRVLVTGAGGYLGRQVVEALRTSGIETIGVVRRDPAGSRIGCMSVCELSDAASVNKLISETSPSAVVHAAAWIGSGSSTADTIATAMTGNVVATSNLVSACAAARVRRLIFCSSVEAYGPEPANGVAHREDDPLSPQGLYGHTKAAGEFIVRSLAGTPTIPIILRMPGLHGAPRSSGFVHRLLTAGPDHAQLELTEPHTRLSFLWVPDAARVLTAAALGEITSAATVLNIANGDTTLHELAMRVGELRGKRFEIRTSSTSTRNRALDLARMREALPFVLPAFEDGLARELVSAQSG